MSLRTSAILASLLGISAVRHTAVQVSSKHIIQNIEPAFVPKDMCSGYMLVVTMYDNGYPSAHRFLEWRNRNIFVKKTNDGCTKTYTAVCSQGSIAVQTTCPKNTNTTTEWRCLGGYPCLGIRAVGGRRSTVGTGEKITVYRSSSRTTTMTSGHVVAQAVSQGIKLEQVPDDPGKKWKAPWGCYCCKSSWTGLGADQNPFSFTLQRIAWSGECMLAWRMFSNYTNGGIPWLVLPQALVALTDICTGTLGRHIACAATCAQREEKFEPYQYSFTKIQNSQDKF